MIPVPSLDHVRVKWILLEGEGYILFGFLLYTSADRVLVDYMTDGIIELDYLSGESCAVFVIESPSSNWVDYTEDKDHSWWRLYGRELLKEERNRGQKSSKRSKSLLEIRRTFIDNIQDSIIVIGDENQMTLRDLVNPSPKLLFNREEALNVAKHFGVDMFEIPCMIFFEHFDSRIIHKLLLGNLQSQQEVKEHFREFFGGAEFVALLDGQRVNQ